ncbi:MAG: biotin/lipoate A/B protein ligase family protein [Hyphomonas sp.]|uniref:lipoate--protein ligase family protein n=1 Tax=Hyphomonas sp. TaxID=87 RepID=UPI003527C948
MAAAFRMIDTGLRSGRANISLDQAMIDARSAGEIGDTLRFISFEPCVLVGRHQAVAQEVQLEYCRANGIEVGRRITGGGTIFMNQGVLGWALVCDKRALGTASLAEITQRVCEAAARGLSMLGFPARFRPRNDIEVEGRKLCGTGGFFDGDIMIYQGTVLGQLDPQVMLSALNVPRAKLEKRGLDDASKRVVTLKELTGAAPDWAAVKRALAQAFSEDLGITLTPDVMSDAETARADELFQTEIGTDDFVYEINDPARDASVHTGQVSTPGGLVAAHVRVEGATSRLIREVLFTGDFFVAPPRIVMDLESSLRGIRIEAMRQHIREFFAGTGAAGLLSIAPDSFADAIESAVAELEGAP